MIEHAYNSRVAFDKAVKSEPQKIADKTEPEPLAAIVGRLEIG